MRRLLGLFLLLCWSWAAWADWRIQVEPTSRRELLTTELERALQPFRELPAAEQQLSFQNASREAVQETLAALGFYDATVEVLVNGSRAELRVVAGEPVRIREVHFQLVGAAAEDAEFSQRQAPFKPGDRLDQGRYESFKQAVADAGLERGYFDGRWLVHRIELNLQQRQADIYLGYDSGQRYRFGQIRFSELDGGPLKALRDRQLDQLTPFEQGQPITSRALFQLQNNLLETRYFRDVQVSFRRDQASDGQVPVDVLVDSRLPSRISLGAGFATDVGPRVLAEWQRPLFNKRGHGIEARSEFSMVRQSGELRYSIPLSHPIEDRLEFAAGAQQDDIDGTETRQAVLSVQRVLQPREGWQQTYGLRLLDERFKRDSGEQGSERILAPYVGFNRLRSLGGVDPYQGSRLFLQLETASTAVASTADYVSLRLGYRWLNTWRDSHMLLLRADAGGIFSPDFERVPPSLRFYAGGDNSVRGFDFRSLSPRNDKGETIGGQYLLAGSVEYNWRWRPTWRPAVFIDAGNAFTRTDDIDYAVGAGVGLRWISPVGPVRIDVASAISEPGAPLRLHLTLGAPL